MTDGWTTVPGFTQVRELGHGASGRVVLAVDDMTKTQVALKYLSDRLRADSALMGRFAAQARALGRIEDPNVVGVYDYVEGPSSAVLVMELVEGVSLRHILATQGPTGPLAALSAFSGSLLGLAVAHSAGIVHGDYRPENVLVDWGGLGKLVDFGLTVPAQDGLWGAPAYLAPEQWYGGMPQPSGDLYAATAVFFECLTGRVPYTARTSAEFARAHRGLPIPAEAVPGPLRALVERGLAKEPGERPASAADFLAELEDAAVGAYGLAWESQGRSRLAEMAARAAAAPAPPARTRSAALGAAAFDGGLDGGEPRRAGSDRTEVSFAPLDRMPQTNRTQTDRTQTDRTRLDHTRLDRTQPDRTQTSPAEADPAQPSHAGTSPAERDWAQPRPAEPDPVEAGRVEAGRVEAGPSRAAVQSAPFLDKRPPAAGHRARGGARRRPAVRIAAGTAIAAVAATVIVVLAMPGGGGKGRVAATDRPVQSPPSAQGGPAPGEAAMAEDLAGRISKAVDAKQTAGFVHHSQGGPGVADTIDASGVFRSAGRQPAAYDLTVWNAGDKRYTKRLRTILVGGTAYVSAGGWKSFPAVHTPVKDDVPHGYATMAANTRWATSPQGILALLHAALSLQQTPVTPASYTGSASLHRLAQDPTEGPFWAAYDTAHYRLTFVLKVGPDDLPQRLEVRLDPIGSAGSAADPTKGPLIFRTSYTHWGRKADIKVP